MTPPTANERRAAFARRIGRLGVLLFCAAYLMATAWFAIRHVLGDSLSHPASYFFTWDMFPGYTTDTSRRMVVGFAPGDGKTRKDRFVKLLPATAHRFRWGINNEVSRFDIDRNPRNVEPAIERAVREYNQAHPGAPLVSVLLVERYWPSRFNLPDDLYRQTYGEPNPHRRYWRFVDVTIEVGPDGPSGPRGAKNLTTTRFALSKPVVRTEGTVPLKFHRGEANVQNGARRTLPFWSTKVRSGRRGPTLAREGRKP